MPDIPTKETQQLRELSLFTGIGGGLLGTKLLGWKAVGYVEFNTYCQQVLQQRIKEGYLDDAPIFGDITEFINEGYAEAYRGYADVITAGFPCQPFSVAGKQKGEADSRNKWPDTIRVIREVRPTYILLENVPAILANPYIHTIFYDLAESGYDCQWDCIRASDTGAPHKRERLWIVAVAKNEGIAGRQWFKGNDTGDGGEWRIESRGSGKNNASEAVAEDVAYASKPRTRMEAYRSGG